MVLPDLESLRCFEAAAKLLHFRLAAAAVALSPTAFSDRIRRLEEQLGAPLFERSTRRVLLTAAGQRLLPHARRLLEEAKRCSEIALDDRKPPFELTVGTRFELGLSWLVPALEPLRQHRPERTLHLRFGDSPDLIAALRQGSVDCAVSSARFMSGRLTFAPLHDEAYVFCGSADLLRRQPLAGAEHAPDHVLLDAHPDLPLFRYLLDALPGGEPWAFARSEQLGTIAAIRHRALQGAGVAVLPKYFVELDLAAGTLVTLLPEVKLASDAFRLIWAKDHPQQGELRALAVELQAWPLC